MRSAADVWEKVKSLMEGSMTAVSIETWFGDVEAVALEDTRLVLCVPTDFKRNIIRTRFQAVVEQALKELFSFDVDVALLLPEERDAYARQPRLEQLDRQIQGTMAHLVAAALRPAATDEEAVKLVVEERLQSAATALRDVSQTTRDVARRLGELAGGEKALDMLISNFVYEKEGEKKDE